MSRVVLVVLGVAIMVALLLWPDSTPDQSSLGVRPGAPTDAGAEPALVHGATRSDPAPGGTGSGPAPEGARSARNDGPEPAQSVPAPSPRTTTGRLVDKEGQPLANARVYVRAVNARGETPYRMIVADANGRFETSPAPAGQVLSLVPAHAGAYLPLGSITAHAGSESIRLVADRGQSLTLRVVGLDMRAAPPAEGVLVQVVLFTGLSYPVRIETKLDAKGEVVLGGLAPPRHDPWHHYVIHIGPFADGRFATARWDTRRDKASGPLELELQRGLTVAGRVQGGEGDSLSVPVIVVDPVHVQYATRSEPDGAFEAPAMHTGYAYCGAYCQPESGARGPRVRCRPGDRDVVLPLRAARK